MPERSDPAEQLFKLCDMLRKHRSEEQASRALAKILGVKGHSADYHVLIGVIASRFARLDDFVLSEIKGAGPKETARSSLAQLQEFLSLPAKGGGSWDSLRSSLFPDPAMYSLSMLSEIVAERAPISVPTAEERDEAIAKIDEALTALANEQDAISGALYASLSASKRMIEKFEFWGGETLADEIVKSMMLYSATVQRPVPTSSGTMSKVAIALSVLLNINVGIDAQVTAFRNNYTLAPQLLEYVTPPRLLLPSPDTPDSSKNGEIKQAIVPTTPSPRERRRSAKK